ncbi:MAG: hypothetical protein AAGE80_07595 [Pseudomonadota bacterium]
MELVVIVWAISAYGLLAAILLTTGYDLLKGKYHIALIGLAALFFSPHVFGFVLDSFGIALNAKVMMFSVSLLSIISVFAIINLLKNYNHTKKTRILCSTALIVSLIAIGSYIAILISPEKRWVQVLPEALAVLFPPVMIGGVPFIFHRALRRLVTLRGA